MAFIPDSTTPNPVLVPPAATDPSQQTTPAAQTPQPQQIQPQQTPQSTQQPQGQTAPQPTAGEHQQAQQIARAALSNPVRAFMSGILQHLAGPAPTDYSVDANGKTVATPEQRTTGGAIRSLASSALAGLAAGAQVQPRKSGLASALAGVGAGANAVSQQQAAADLLKRKQATDEFEQQQRAIVQKSNMAHMNGAALTNWFANVKAGNDMDPIIQHDKSEFDAVMNSPELGHGTIMTDAQVQAAMTKDPHWATENAVYHLGRTPVLDDDGKPVTDKNGNPLSQVQLGVVPAHDGKYVVPQSFVDDLQQYGKYSGSMDQTDIDRWKAGMEVPFNDYVLAKAHVLQGENVALKGWEKPDIVWSADGKTPMIRNAVTGEIKPYPNGVVPNVKNEPAESSATAADKAAQAAKARTGAALDAQQLVNLKNLGVNVPANYTPNPNAFSLKPNELQQTLTSQGIQMPSNFQTLYAAAHYKTGMDTFPTQLRKGVNGMTRDQANTFIRTFINPNFDSANYGAVKDMEKEFASTKPNTAGGNLIAFNTGTDHLGALYTAAQALQNGNIQALNEVAQRYGIATGRSPAVTFDVIRGAVAGELDKTFKGGVGDVAGTADIKSTISHAQSPQQASDVAKQYAHLMLSKAGEITNHYYALTGERPAESISPAAAKVYQMMGINAQDVMPQGAYVPQGQNAGAGSQTQQQQQSQPQSGGDPFAQFGGAARKQ